MKEKGALIEAHLISELTLLEKKLNEVNMTQGRIIRYSGKFESLEEAVEKAVSLGVKLKGADFKDMKNYKRGDLNEERN